MIRNAPAKHPNSSKWYWLEWSEQELDGATIDAIQWWLPLELTNDAQGVSGRRVGVRLGGGTLGGDYIVWLQVHTSGGETLNESMLIRIRESGH